MEIAFTPAAWRDWRKLPKDVQERLRAKLRTRSADPQKHAVKLTNSAIGNSGFALGTIVSSLTSQDLH